MANAYTGTTSQFSTPYLTVAEFKSAPTSIDINNLDFQSQYPQDQDAELANVIARASSWIDTFCNQVLAATNETEQQRSRIKSDGTIRLHPRYNPIVALTSFSYGNPNTQMQTIPDCSIAWIEPQEIIVPYAQAAMTWSSQGPLQFGFPSSPRIEVFLRYSYVAGYANTTLTTATAGSSSIVVANGIGIMAGQELKIYDGMYSETVTVDSTYTFGSTTVPLVSPLLYSHDNNESISALPPAVKQAAILVTTAFLKVRGDSSMTMAIANSAGATQALGGKYGEEIELAQQLLIPYKRVR